MTWPILYAEVPCFYASVEAARGPVSSERGERGERGETGARRPLIVGGDPRKRGLVQSASPEALAAGVAPGMPMIEALERCPRARAVRTDMKRYREASNRLRACLRVHVDGLEPVALGSAFLAARPEPGGGPPDVPALAGRLVAEVEAAMGLPLRVGAAPVKFLARLAAEQAGPDGLREIRPGQEAAFLAPLAVDRLPGVGPKAVASLRGLGVATVADLSGLDAGRVEATLGNHGLRILELAAGREDAVIRARSHPRSLGREQTFERPTLDLGELWDGLQRLAGLLAGALREQGLAGCRVAVKVRYDDGQTNSRSRTVSRSLRTAAEIHALAVDLLDRTHAGSRPVRLLGLSLSRLESGQDPGEDRRQLSLFGGEEPG